MSSTGDEDKAGFSLAGTDTSFSSKSADIFGSLSALEKKHESVQQAISKEDKTGLLKDDPVLDLFGKNQGTKRDKSDMRHQDRERKRDYGPDFKMAGDKRDAGGFRVPQGRPPRSAAPQHKRDPGKFTHYNLSDTTEMSDRSNSAAAFDFLNKLKKQKEEAMDEDDDDDDDGKIVFRKPTTTAKDTTAEKKGASSGFGKRVMPEYVVGQKTGANKAKPKGTVADSSKIDLGHLEDNDETEEKNQDGGSAVAFKKVSRKAQRRKRDEEEEEEETAVNEGGTKRKADEEEEDVEEEGRGIVRRDRGAERRKKSRAKMYQRKQLADSASEDEEEWQEELRRAREEEGQEEEEEKAGESVEDMNVEGL